MNELENRDAILAAAKKEKYSGKEYENRASARGTLLASLVALIVGIILFFVEFFIRRTWNFGLISVAMTAAGVQHLYEGIRFKSAWRIVVGSLGLIIALMFILCFVVQVMS